MSQRYTEAGILTWLTGPGSGLFLSVPRARRVMAAARRGSYPQAGRLTVLKWNPGDRTYEPRSLA